MCTEKCLISLVLKDNFFIDTIAKDDLGFNLPCGFQFRRNRFGKFSTYMASVNRYPCLAE